MNATSRFRAARDFLLHTRTDYAAASRDFRWPELEHFNWALDWFDVIARDNSRTALRVVGGGDADCALSFEELRVRSNRIAALLHDRGLARGDRILLMLGNCPQLWEVMLAALKLGCPVIPAAPLLMNADLKDRVERGAVRAIVTDEALAPRFEGLCAQRQLFVAAGRVDGWQSLGEAEHFPNEFSPPGITRGTDLSFIYFTSGTTARPKLVAHSHVSYPVGHLSTMYWLGLKPGDVHLNLSSPGWAKHAYSSFFAPWSAQACVVAMRSGPFDPRELLEQLVRCEATAFCAPPTVWRALVQLPLAQYPVQLREALSAGEPLNPEIIVQVRAAWDLTIRDGYGQTESTLQIGNFPGEPVLPGKMGRPAPGCRIRLIDEDGQDAAEGEICIEAHRTVGIAPSYIDDGWPVHTRSADGLYHTKDLAALGTDGFYTYIGRNDDVFKSSDYRVSPFELESVLIEHPFVAEAAVVPSPDERRLCVPKAFVALKAGVAADAASAAAIFKHARERVSPFKRIRRIEFAELPKTISGKIRRIELRQREAGREPSVRMVSEFWDGDLDPKR